MKRKTRRRITLEIKCGWNGEEGSCRTTIAHTHEDKERALDALGRAVLTLRTFIDINELPYRLEIENQSGEKQVVLVVPKMDVDVSARPAPLRESEP